MQETIAILLVDDEPRNLDALEAILDDPTYRLLRADNAETALRLLLSDPKRPCGRRTGRKTCSSRRWPTSCAIPSRRSARGWTSS
jgi:hypothetical protein